jgi:hypothetical protein
MDDVIGVEVLTDTDGSQWLIWKDNPRRLFEFHTLKLTDEHGNMLECDIVEA